MPFWRKDNEEEARQKLAAAQAAQDQVDSLLALGEGGLPVQATKRLSEQAARGSGFFSSTLSPKEFLLACEGGYKPIGQVMGSAFMRVAYNVYLTGNGPGYTGEIDALTLAHKQSRTLAMTRLRQEAQLLGADGIIGVHIKTSNFSWSSGVTEFTAVGTAIKVPDRTLLEGVKNLPFTSTLSGQEFWQLFESGYQPCGLVMSNCSYFVFGDRSSRNSMAATFSNQEMQQLTYGLNSARAIAEQRLITAIAAEEADGAVDMDISYRMHHMHAELNEMHYLNMLVNFDVMGTAIKRRVAGPVRINHQPLMLMDLRKGARRALELELEGDLE